MLTAENGGTCWVLNTEIISLWSNNSVSSYSNQSRDITAHNPEASASPTVEKSACYESGDEGLIFSEMYKCLVAKSIWPRPGSSSPLPLGGGGCGSVGRVAVHPSEGRRVDCQPLQSATNADLCRKALRSGKHFINTANLPLHVCLKANVQFHNLPCRVRHSISSFRSESLRAMLCPQHSTCLLPN